MGKRVEGRICVVGAGVAGVATAAALASESFDFVVYEKKENLGGLWLNNYPGASVQTTAEQYELPGKKYPPHIRNRKDPPTPTALEVQDYLREWCQENGTLDRFEFGINVTNISKTPNGEWIVESTNKGKEKFAYVILCTGLFSNTPNILDIPGLDKFKAAGGVVEHTSTWKSTADFANKKVLVIGNGKSAADAAVAASKVAVANGTQPPIQAIRKQNWYVPRIILNLKWAFHSRFVSALLPRYYFEHDDPVTVFLHTIFAPFKWILWRILELAFIVLLRLPPKIWPNLGTMETESALSVPLLVTDERHLGPIRRGEIDMRICQVVKLEPGKAYFNTGDTAEIDMIVFGTGWKLDYSFLDKDTVRSKLDLGEDGLWLYRNMLAPGLPGIAFIMANCLTFMNMFTAHVQAYWLLGLLTGEREYPDDETMLASIATEKAFKRGRYPSCPIRGASIEAFMQHYHDILFREQGINPRVYGGIFAPFLNMFFPLMPETMEASYAKLKAQRKKKE